MLTVDAMASEVVRALDRAGCSSILLKGTTLQRELHSDGSLRRYVDADLLVSPRDVDAAGAVLAALGFKLVLDHRDHLTIVEPHAQEWGRPPANKVDLHWRVPGVGAPASDAWGLLEAHTVPLPIGNVTARGLDRVGIALLTALHAAHHGPGLRKPLDDLARALDQFDGGVWRQAALLARRLDATDAFVGGLRLSSAGEALARDLRLPAIGSSQRALMVSSAPPGSLGLLRVLVARGDRVRMVRDTLFPGPELMRQNYPLARRGRRGLVLAHCGRLLARAWSLPAALHAVRDARGGAAGAGAGAGAEAAGRLRSRPMPSLVRHPLIDEILDSRRELARGQDLAFEGYRNHAHRVLSFALAVFPDSPSDEDREKLAIAAAFHDLYAFDGLDYLEPSIEAAASYLRDTGREAWDREVALTIAFHHRVRPYKGEAARLVEPFRRADWNDFTMGLVSGGVPRALRKAADAELPVGDFVPKAVTKLALSWVPRHPLRPAPPFRGGAALRRSGRG
jgi:hypothetical protein